MVKELFLYTEKAAADTESQRRITAVVSSEAIDRDGEIVTAAAMKAAMTEYMQNPVIIASHQHKLPDGESSVIGKVASWYQEKKRTYCEIEFADTPMGLRYWTLYKGKYQRAFSIGFRSRKGDNRNIDGKSVYVHTEIELFEISACAVPANQEALSKAAKRRAGFVASKRSGIGNEPDYEFEIAALGKHDDFLAGRLDGISEKELAYLKNIDRKSTEYWAYVDDPENWKDCGDEFLENAPGCPTIENYHKAFNGLDEGDFDESGKSCGVCEPNYASLFKN